MESSFLVGEANLWQRLCISSASAGQRSDFEMGNCVGKGVDCGEVFQKSAPGMNGWALKDGSSNEVALIFGNGRRLPSFCKREGGIRCWNRFAVSGFFCENGMQNGLQGGRIQTAGKGH